MKKKFSYIFSLLFIFVFIFLFLFTVHSSAFSDNVKKICKNLVMVLVSGRSVIAKNQMLINNPEIGNKGLSAEVFIKKMSQEYKLRTGKDLINNNLVSSNKVFSKFIDSVKEVLNEAQPLINKKGEGFKGFIPAIFGRYVGEHFMKKTGIILKQTSVRYRNRANKPDAFERKILLDFEKTDYPKGKDYGELTEKDNRKVYRYMKPLYIEKACLQCHGGPAGEIDITGRKKEGYREGELRGAISIALPMD